MLINKQISELQGFRGKAPPKPSCTTIRRISRIRSCGGLHQAIALEVKAQATTRPQWYLDYHQICLLVGGDPDKKNAEKCGKRGLKTDDIFGCPS